MAKTIQERVNEPQRRIPKIRKNQVYNFLAEQGIEIPACISEEVDVILSKIQNPDTTSWASYHEARRCVEVYLRIADGNDPLAGKKSREAKLYELLDAWERQGDRR